MVACSGKCDVGRRAHIGMMRRPRLVLRRQRPNRRSRSLAIAWRLSFGRDRTARSTVAMGSLSYACQPIGRTQMRYSGAPGPRCRVALHGWSSRQRRNDRRSVARRPKSSFAGYGRTDCKRGVAPCQSSRRSHMSLSRSATLTAAASGISDFSVQIRSLTRTPVRFIRLFGR